jgi:hypothetical protein
MTKVGAAMVVIGASIASAQAEPPTWGVQGFPMSQHQAQLLVPGDIAEHATAAIPLLGGMPVSPAQLAILSRSRPIGRLEAGPIVVQSTARAELAEPLDDMPPLQTVDNSRDVGLR